MRNLNVGLPPNGFMEFKRHGSHPGGGKCDRLLEKKNPLPQSQGGPGPARRAQWPLHFVHNFRLLCLDVAANQNRNKTAAIGLSGELGFIAKGADRGEGSFYGMCGAVAEVFL